MDANDDPTAEADLAVYRATYGLPPCTTANGCFTKVNQDGQTTPLPAVDGGWAVEISLDLDTVSASCPNCKLLLVEGSNASAGNLATAENTAVALGANVVSNSYTIAEDGDLITEFASSYVHPGVPIVAASGDVGYQMQPNFPASIPTVTAVGGTSLVRSHDRRGWTEDTWHNQAKANGAGSGCSAYFAKPSWQHDTACPGRTVADVSAVADPRTGTAAYDTTPNDAGIPTGWFVIGGTSVATPLIAGVYGLAGDTSNVDDPSRFYTHGGSLNDVVGGNNTIPNTSQDCPSTSYVCTAVRGYDGPTGVGTPNGTGAF